MSTFEIGNLEGKWSVKLNDVEIGPLIRDGGVRIEFDRGGMPPVVHIELIPEKLFIKLPQAIVEMAEVSR